jgi:hypothetical protein
MVEARRHQCDAHALAAAGAFYLPGHVKEPAWMEMLF